MSSEDKKHYDRIVYLRKEGTGWCLYSDKGFRLTDPVKYDNKTDAVMWANAWISSFSSMRLVVEGDESEKS